MKPLVNRCKKCQSWISLKNPFCKKCDFKDYAYNATIKKKIDVSKNAFGNEPKEPEEQSYYLKLKQWMRNLFTR